MFARLLACLSIIFATSFAAFAADPFTVSGVGVDAQGESAISAQTEAISAGQLQAANILIDRLTLSSERASRGYAGLDIQSAAKLIRGMEIANEKRSADRYLGDITVAFNPAAVRDYIAASGMNMIATQARMRLVLPILDNGDLWTDNPWSEVWQDAKFTHALTPMQGIQTGQGNNSIIDSSRAASGNINALNAIGGLYGVNQIIIARASTGYNGVTVSLTDVSLDSGQKNAIGSVTGIDLEEAAYASVARMQDDWKQAAANTAQNAVSMNVSILYRTHADWQRLQTAINGSSQITDARLDALSKDGALMTITYGGDLARLGNELSYKGVKLDTGSKLGTTLTLAGRY